jgi:RNA polymerase sigma-70 factor (ECF subfamily)
MAVAEDGLFIPVGVEEAIAVSSTDAALLARLKAGERAAFEEFVATYQGLVYELSYRLLGDPEDARDATQETFLKVYRHVGNFRGESGLKTWLYRIAVNQASNQRRWWRRRRKKDMLSLDAAPDDARETLADRLASRVATPEQVALDRERERRMMEALETLKHDFRVAVVLRDVQDLSYEEIAETVGVSVGTVKSRIARGREELRRRLRDTGV